MIPLYSPAGYEYDPETQTLVFTCIEAAPADHPDPASFVPSRSYTFRVPAPSVTTNP
jgi:hypothetical protein